MEKLPKLSGLNKEFIEGDIFAGERSMDPENDLIKTSKKDDFLKDLIGNKERNRKEIPADKVFKYDRKLRIKRPFEKRRVEEKIDPNFWQNLTRSFLKTPKKITKIQAKFHMDEFLDEINKKPEIDMNFTPPKIKPIDYAVGKKYFTEKFLYRKRKMKVYDL